MERCSLREAGIRMASWLGSQISTTPVVPREILREPLSEENNPPLGFVLHKVDPWHSYVAQRGIQIATAKTFGAGFYNGGGFHAGRIVIPIHDHAGCLVAYAGRSIAGEEPKYRFPAGFRKSLVLFNFHRAVQSGEKTAIVVEGFFDAMKVHQAGHANVVALMGSSLSQRQSDLLAEHFDRATIMLDGDAAGRHAADVIERLLAPRMNVTRRDLGVGRQPDQMQTRDINAILGPGPRRARSLER